MSKKAVIISIIILAVLGLYLANKKFNFFGNMGRPKDAVRKLSYFNVSEFDSPAEYPSDNGKDVYNYKGKDYLLNSGQENMKQGTLLAFDLARGAIENDWNRNNPLKRIVFRINSGYRTPIHNAEVGGVSTSSHMSGYGADISTAGYNEEQKKEMLKELYNAGFRRFGIGRNSIHADNDPTKPSQIAVWNYPDANGNTDYELAYYEINDIEALV